MKSIAARKNHDNHRAALRPSSRGLFRGLLLIAALAALALAGGCAPKAAPRPAAEQPPAPMSPEAKFTYDYLLFQDQRGKLERLARSGASMNREEFDQAMQLQESAAAAADRILAVQPSPELYGEKASLFFNAEQLDRARDILEQGLEAYPGDRHLVGLLASAYLLEGNSTSAALLLEEYLFLAPEDHAMRQRLAGVLIDAQEYAKGLDQLNVIPEAERNKTALYLQARAEARLGKRRQALATLEQALERDPDYYEAWAEVAYLRELESDLPGAIKAYTRLLELGGPEEEIRIRLVTLLLKLNDVDEALRTAMEGPPDKAFVLSASNAFLNQNFPAQASALLDTLAGFDPVPTEYFFYKAVIAFEAEENQSKALEYLDQVPRGDDRYDEALEFRIQILYSQERPEEALELIRQAQKDYPDKIGFYQMEAEYWISEERNDRARQALERGLEQRPDNPDLLYRYGALLDQMGEREAGLEIMERIVTSDPRHADALNYIGYTLAEQGRDLKRAQVLIENALLQEPDNGYIIDSLAWVHFKAGNLEEAWEQIQRAVREVPKDPTIWEHYGDIAAAMGKTVSALEAYRKALQYQTEHPERVKEKIEAL